jgi:hypothetical protein
MSLHVDEAGSLLLKPAPALMKCRQRLLDEVSMMSFAVGMAALTCILEINKQASCCMPLVTAVVAQ